MPAIDVARGVAFAAAALAVGTVLFTALVWLPAVRRQSGERERTAPPGDGDGAFVTRAASLVLAASLGGLAATLLVLTLGDLPATRGPLAWGAAAFAFAVLAVVSATCAREPVRVRNGVAGAFALAASGALVLVPGISGNVAGEDPAALLVAVNAVHVAAASIWAGGIACLLVAVPPGIAALPERRRNAQQVDVVARFSAVALLAVVALALTGVVQGIALVGRIDALVTTGYGRLVLVKGALLCVLALAGAVHRSRTLPALRAAGSAGDQTAAGAALRRLLIGEAALLAAVFVATAALAATPPASADDGSRSAQSRGRLGAFDVLLTARPGRPGVNEISIALSGGSGPAPARLMASARQRRLGIAPFALTVTRTAPRRFRIEDASLPAPGTWEIALVAEGVPPARLSLRLR